MLPRDALHDPVQIRMGLREAHLFEDIGFLLGECPSNATLNYSRRIARCASRFVSLLPSSLLEW
jgi:imidazoleglycerol phosphate dehydratase HisB